MKLKRDIKVKVTPIKTADSALCKRCKFAYRNYCPDRNCKDCEMRDEYRRCKCTTVRIGQPCPYFERSEKEAQ